MPSKTITIEDTPEAVAGRLPGFHLVNPTGLASNVRIHQEDAPAGLIYYRVHCGDIEAASAQIVLRIEKGKCVISLRFQNGLQVHGKPQPRDDLQRCKGFCAGFLAHLAAEYPPAESAYKAASLGPPKAPENGAGADLWLDYRDAMMAAGYPFTLRQAARQSNPEISEYYLRKRNSARRKK